MPNNGPSRTSSHDTAELEAVNPDRTDYIDEIDVVRPFFLRYGVENDIVDWFGIIDCAFEMLVP